MTLKSEWEQKLTNVLDLEKEYQLTIEREKEKYHYKLEKEEEYLEELRLRMHEELRKQLQWDEIKAAKLMTGQWKLVKTTTSQPEIIRWCTDNLPANTYIPSCTNQMSKEWLIKVGEHLTTFTLRWA